MYGPDFIMGTERLAGVACPHCGSTRTWKVWLRWRRDGRRIKWSFCDDCRDTFDRIESPGAEAA
jgi:DNA-directed RNA polymerase subunit RPC12/RpoP